MSKESLRKIFQCLNSNKRPSPIAWQVKWLKWRAIFFFKVRVSLESWPPASQWREIGFWNPVPKGAIHSTKISGIFRSKTLDRFGPTGKVSKKRVHLFRWTNFPGRTGWNFGWMDRTPILWIKPSRTCRIHFCYQGPLSKNHVDYILIYSSLRPGA